ncbi:MAG TPA: serine/threonine-protein kinase [Actinocrinis sp.]|jgi:serine/threonine-protein kinase
MTLAGRYEVEQRLGSGSMGIVWQARDTRLDRQVAVKLAVDNVSSDPDASQAHQRLRHEAIAIGAMTEPRIARVYDFLEADDDAFIVMELVEGESLATRLDRERRLSVDEALRITMQCAQALEAAHRAGIVHRDVKPSNIMLAEDGVKVVDFGIAASADRSLTSSSGSLGLAGTAAYISPERAMGAPASPPADFYALGVVLYQMLSGHLPFAAEESLSILYAHVTAQPLPLPEFIPAPLSGLCMRLLDKNPYARPASVRAIETALDSAGSEPPAPPAATTEPAAPPPEAGRRRAGRIALGKPLAAVVLGGAVLIAATAWVTLDVAGPTAMSGIGPSQSSSPPASATAPAAGPGDVSGASPRQGSSSNGSAPSTGGTPSTGGLLPNLGGTAPSVPVSSGSASDSAPGIQPSLVGGPENSGSASASASATACATERGHSGKCKDSNAS